MRNIFKDLRRTGGAVLAGLLIVAMALPALGAAPPEEVRGTEVSTAEELIASLERDGDEAIIVRGTIEIDARAIIAVAGDKTIHLLDEGMIHSAGTLYVSDGASVSITGGTVVVDAKESIGIIVDESRLRIERTALWLNAYGVGTGLLNVGGRVDADGIALMILCSGEAVGYHNVAGGHTELTRSVLQVVDEGGEEDYTIGIINESATMRIVDTQSFIDSAGPNLGIGNGSGEPVDTSSLYIGGGYLWIRNMYDSVGICNYGEMTFFDLPVYLYSTGEGGIQNRGGSMRFRSSTLEFMAPEEAVANIENAADMRFEYTNVVINTTGTCINNDGGNVSSGGGNNLLTLREGSLFSVGDDHGLSDWRNHYYAVALDVSYDGQYLTDKTYTLESSWPGHRVYAIDPDTRQLYEAMPLRVGGETIRISSEGYMTESIDAPADPVPVTMTMVVSLRPRSYDALVLWLIALGGGAIMAFYQRKYGTTYVPPRRRKKKAE